MKKRYAVFAGHPEQFWIALCDVTKSAVLASVQELARRFSGAKFTDKAVPLTGTILQHEPMVGYRFDDERFEFPVGRQHAVLVWATPYDASGPSSEIATTVADAEMVWGIVAWPTSVLLPGGPLEYQTGKVVRLNNAMRKVLVGSPYGGGVRHIGNVIRASGSAGFDEGASLRRKSPRPVGWEVLPNATH